MKRFDFFALILIGMAAVFFGSELASSVEKTIPNLIVKDLRNLDAFEKKTEKQEVENTDQYLLARQWEWSGEITLQAGQEYNLHIASGDIQHGFHLEKAVTGRSVDILLQPGKVYILRLKVLTPGLYAIGCTQYCGIEHNKMRGRLIVRN